jgi:hypothetical protein
MGEKKGSGEWRTGKKRCCGSEPEYGKRNDVRVSGWWVV